MKNLTPLFVLCCIGIMVAIVSSFIGTPKNVAKYPTTNTYKSPKPETFHYKTKSVNQTLPYKKKEGVIQQTFIDTKLPTYTKPEVLPISNIQLSPVNSILGQSIYESTWNNLITISNPSLSPTRYVTISRSIDVATGITTIRYR